jgi:hypothetical protein
MKQNTDCEKDPGHTYPGHQGASAGQISAVLMGFVFFLTGIFAFVVAGLDAFHTAPSTKTLLFLGAGALLFKIGQFILYQCASLRLKDGRRRHVAI